MVIIQLKGISAAEMCCIFRGAAQHLKQTQQFTLIDDSRKINRDNYMSRDCTNCLAIGAVAVRLIQNKSYYTACV